MRFSRSKLNEFAADQEAGARHAEEAAADAHRTAADSSQPQHVRDFAARAAGTHKQNACQLRENARNLRDGYQPDEL